MDHNKDEYVVSLIKGLIDPKSKNFMPERNPYVGGRSTSTWATLEQIERAVNSLNYNVSVNDLEDICFICTCHPLHGYSAEQFAVQFNKKYNKQP